MIDELIEMLKGLNANQEIGEREGQRPRHMKTLDCNHDALAGFAAPYGSETDN